MKITTFGDAALLVQLARPDVAATKTIATQLRALGVYVDVVAGSSEVAVSLGGDDANAARTLRERVDAAIARGATAAPAGTTHEIAVVFDGEDLPRLAEKSGRAVLDVVTAFVAETYAVRLLGFMPGFAYLETLPEALRFPRLASPRRRIAPGTVAIAGELAGVYPAASPGGWNLLGRVVGAPMFDPSRPRPALLAEHDRVRFSVAEATSVVDVAPPTADLETGPGIRVVRAPPGTTVQDRGRSGMRHVAVPRSGPLDPARARAANAAVGNDVGAALVEIPSGSFVAVATVACDVSVDGEPPRRLAVDDEITIPETGAFARYLAVRGGIDVPIVLGARATFVPGGFGGHHGRILRRGDLLRIDASGEGEGSDSSGREDLDAPDAPDAIVVDATPGPHLDRFPASATDTLGASTFEVGPKSRVGTRLVGPAIPRAGFDDRPPEPMIPGAVQIATDGTLLVLGPDAATTGGYPVLAVLGEEALGRLGRARAGTRVRFRVR